MAKSTVYILTTLIMRISFVLIPAQNNAHLRKSVVSRVSSTGEAELIFFMNAIHHLICLHVLIINNHVKIQTIYHLAFTLSLLTVSVTQQLASRHFLMEISYQVIASQLGVNIGQGEGLVI